MSTEDVRGLSEQLSELKENSHEVKASIKKRGIITNLVSLAGWSGTMGVVLKIAALLYSLGMTVERWDSHFGAIEQELGQVNSHILSVETRVEKNAQERRHQAALTSQNFAKLGLKTNTALDYGY